jgi:ferritin-like metal-binding protein YciE
VAFPDFRMSGSLPSKIHTASKPAEENMQTAHELFIHELTDMLSAERQLVEALGEQANNASNNQLKKAFESHRAQTEKQVERLEKCFEELGEPAEETECKGMKGLIEEYQTFANEEDPAEDILDVFAIDAAKKVEDYEINAYKSMIELADMMEHTRVSKLLQQNLREEESNREKMEKLGEKIQPENMGMEEEGDEEEGTSYEMGEDEEEEMVMSGEEERPSRRSGKKSSGRSTKRSGRKAA